MQRIEAAVAVAGNFDAQRAVLGGHGLAALAIELAGRRIGLGGAARVSQVMAELSAQGALDQRLLERHRRSVHLIAGHGLLTNRSSSSLEIAGNAADFAVIAAFFIFVWRIGTNAPVDQTMP